MKQRGRRSKAALSTISPAGDGPRSRLEPPDHLSQAEANLFRDVVLSCPPNQFSPSDQYLLETFCRITILIRNAAEAAANANNETSRAKHKLLFEAIKTQTLVATKLRLATQSRTSTRTIGRAHAEYRPSFYDQMKLEEWQ